jgi:hypothetical protein
MLDVRPLLESFIDRSDWNADSGVLWQAAPQALNKSLPGAEVGLPVYLPSAHELISIDAKRRKR